LNSTLTSTSANSLTNQFNELSFNENNNELNKQMSPSSIASSSSSTTSSSFCSNIPSTANCICSYTAITEDEICLQKGDLVQIITANLHNRFLVHREATNLQPAAEGWVPGFVIGFKTPNTTTATTTTNNNNKV
jgi:hypothetical protein